MCSNSTIIRTQRAKVVGVGSVGTRCWISAFIGRDIDDPLILQMKEAVASVLAKYVGHSPYSTHGERVIQGQKLVQSTADILLGWSRFVANDGLPRDYYVRQLWNGKGSIDLDTLHADSLSNLGSLCAWCLAHAHARSGDSVAISRVFGRQRRIRDGDDELLRFIRPTRTKTISSCSPNSSHPVSSLAHSPLFGDANNSNAWHMIIWWRQWGSGRKCPH